MILIRTFKWFTLVNIIMVRKLEDGIFVILKSVKKILCIKLVYKNFFSGGGSYDDDGVGIKIGKWIELINSQIALQGDYENGKKIGRWNIIELPDGKIQNELGSYYGKDEIK